MLIQEIEICGYRSIKDIRLQLANVTVLVGANGSGKSNIYQALQLVAACAQGDLGRQIMREGGVSSVLWAGPQKKFDEPRFSFRIGFDDLSYELECGRVPLDSRRSDGRFGAGLIYFVDDPDIKSEAVRFKHGGKTISLFERKRASITARNLEGENADYPGTIESNESVLSALREPHKFPELSLLRMELINWRFYHEFRTDMHSPVRQPQVATLTTVMNNDASDLVAALATIMAVGDSAALSSCVSAAFPGSKLSIDLQDGKLSMYMSMPDLRRSIGAREFSDGTLQYLCLLGALLTPRPGSLVVLNEPETSIHVDLYPSLAELICTASANTQILVTTHSRELSHLIKKRVRNHAVIELQKIDGATQLQC